jgi:hypothetical protein
MKNALFLLRASAACIGFAMPTMLLAQQPVASNALPSAPAGLAASSLTAVTPRASAPAKTPASEDAAGRWLNLSTMSESQRFRRSFNQGGFVYFDDGQQRSLIQGRINLDPEARYTIGFRASSGHFFNWAYADYAGEGFSERVKDTALLLPSYNAAELQERTLAIAADPAGLAVIHQVQSNGWQFYLRELYFSASPLKAITVEFGSFGIERGLGTEITTFDDDGYLSGERIRIRDAKHLFFDQIGFTNAFFGSYGTANLLDRGSDLKKSNYHQVFADKRINSRIGVSGEYVWLIGTNTLRGAALIAAKEVKVADSFRLEAYERMNSVNLQGLEVGGGAGFSVTAQKKLGTRLSGDLGFASIDKDNTAETGSRFFHAVGFGLNGDAFGQGKRPFIRASCKINSYTTAFGFFTHEVGGRVLNNAQQGINAGLEFDLKTLVNQEKRIF